MSIEILNEAGGVVTVEVAGELEQPEVARAQRSVGEIIDKQGKVKLLVLAERFGGWVHGGDWGDVSFQAKYDRFIEKIAIVGDKKRKFPRGTHSTPTTRGSPLA